MKNIHHCVYLSLIFLFYFKILESKKKEERFGTSNSMTPQKNYKFGKKET